MNDINLRHPVVSHEKHQILLVLQNSPLPQSLLALRADQDGLLARLYTATQGAHGYSLLELSGLELVALEPAWRRLMDGHDVVVITDLPGQARDILFDQAALTAGLQEVSWGAFSVEFEKARAEAQAAEAKPDAERPFPLERSVVPNSRRPITRAEKNARPSQSLEAPIADGLDDESMEG